MGLFRWFQGKSAGDRRLTQWRTAWQRVCDAPNKNNVAVLTADLDSLGLSEDDIEFEREMLAALADVVALEETIATDGLPVIPSGHRVLGSEPCHFTASCSMPDEPGEPSGRLMLSSVRAIFVGGASSVVVPWHAVAQVLHQQRDLILVRRDREMMHRFRCNVFSDTLSATLLARTLAVKRPSV
jgi:hypothetical protein